MLTPQLRAALVRAVLPAVTAAVLAYFGVDSTTDDAAQGAATAAIEDPETDVTAGNSEEVIDDAAGEGKEDATDPAVVAAVTGFLILFVRGGLEGGYDTWRQRDPLKRGKPGDVGVTEPPKEPEPAKERDVPGAWVQIKEDPGDWYYVLSARRIDQAKDKPITEYLVLHPRHHTPKWVKGAELVEETMQLYGAKVEASTA